MPTAQGQSSQSKAYGPKPKAQGTGIGHWWSLVAIDGHWLPALHKELFVRLTLRPPFFVPCHCYNDPSATFNPLLLLRFFSLSFFTFCSSSFFILCVSALLQ